MGATVIGAGTAHAVVSNWGCDGSITPISGSEVYGTHCTGSGSGVGYFNLEPLGIMEYQCSHFSAAPMPLNPGFYDVTGTGCVVPQ
jgi:hypothetical protein